MAELKDCPFCGEQPEIITSNRWPKDRDESVTGYSVVCKNSDCIIYYADNQYYLSEQEAAEKWNRRYNDIDGYIKRWEAEKNV